MQNSEMVLYCRLIRLKKVVAVDKIRGKKRNMKHVSSVCVCYLLHRNKSQEEQMQVSAM